MGGASENPGARNEIYDALVARASEGRMGGAITFSDYAAGLLGPEGRAYAANARRALEQAGVPVDAANDCEFLGVTSLG